ncbi:MAG: hypothetical protein QGH83_00330 [Candidatus Pacebacteria bacterium]|jgi:hypothetical protein|nr:hypothetical protein [Candidatus Paceibacterota bacterium]
MQTAGKDIYNVYSVISKKVVEVGFDKKMDAKDKRNELSAKTWKKWKKKKKDHPEIAKPFPYIIVKGKEHPKY